MHILGYIAAALIGLSLGLIGGGGSILTVPVLVYLFGIAPPLATSYSLFVVGTTSLAGAIKNYKSGLVNIKVALVFGAASVTTVFVTRKFLVPHIPAQLLHLGGFTVTSSLAIMVLFGLLMVAASLSMIKNNTVETAPAAVQANKTMALLGYGTTVGLVTGLLGAGGGFLLIPALVFVLHLPMKTAIGTSLTIIAINSLTGFLGDWGHFSINWVLLGTITLLAIAGIVAGSKLSQKIKSSMLKRAFGWFVLGMGIYVILTEIFMR